MYSYKTRGTCSRSIQFDVVDGVVRDVCFEGGCNGNLKGIGKLVEVCRRSASSNCSRERHADRALRAAPTSLPKP